jgi:uncharacterized protein YqeY
VGLKDQIQADIKDCIKAGDKAKLTVLRMLLSELQYAQTAVDASVKLDDDQALKVAASYQKKLQKALGDFPEGDKKQQILFEISIVEAYLPKRADDSAVAAVVDRVLSATADRNFGTLMKQVMAELGSLADGKTVSKVLKERLS